MKYGIRNGTGDKQMGRGDKPTKDVAEGKGDKGGPKAKGKLQKRKAAAFRKVK